jgi:putative transposase
MKEYQSLTHTTWDCKYHVVFIPKCRKQRIFGALRRELGTMFHELAGQKESRIVEGHLMPDHVHMCISIPPKYAVAHVVGYIKGKSAIQVARRYGGRKRNFTGEHFWPADILFRRWGWMRQWFVLISVIRKLKTNVTTR